MIANYSHKSSRGHSNPGIDVVVKVMGIIEDLISWLQFATEFFLFKAQGIVNATDIPHGFQIRAITSLRSAPGQEVIESLK